MTMTEFSGPEHPLLEVLHEAEADAPVTDLPALDPEYTKQPVSESERADDTSPRQAPPVAQARGQTPLEGITAGEAVRAPGGPAAAPPPPLDPAAMRAYADRELIAGVQQDSIEGAHRVAELEADLYRTQRALQMLALSIAVAAGLIALIVIRQHRQDGGVDGPLFSHARADTGKGS